MSAMLKLKRLRVERFRSLVRGTELSFSDGINVVLGQNGTGKTTLLELISMVVRSDFSSLATEEFAIEYELAIQGGESVAVIIRNTRTEFEPQPVLVDLGTREAFRPWAEVFGGQDHRWVVQYDAERGFTRSDESSDHAAVSPLDRGFILFYLPSTGVSVELATHLSLHVCNALRLDESLDLFRQIIATGEMPGNIMAPGGRHWFPDPLAPPLIPERVLDKLEASYRADKKPDYSLSHKDLDLLRALKDHFGFHASNLRVDLQLTPTRIKISNLIFRFWWRDGTFITHERLSYGQKRLLALFYYLDCNPDIVISDELVNGLHHRWITASIEAIGQRQAFLTSQNPLLLDYIPITSAEEVRRSFVLCRGEPREGRPGWIWENMSEEDARELYSAYEVGVEHVSEILQSRGLW